MRVAYITHYADLYGANRSLLDLVRQLKRSGTVEPFILLPQEGRLSEILALEEIPFAVVPFQPWMSDRYYGGRLHHRLFQFIGHRRAARHRIRGNVALMPSLVALLRTWNIDIIHANSAAVGIAVDLARRLGRPLVWHIREMPERHYGLHLDPGSRGFGKALRKAKHLILVSKAVGDDLRRYTPVLPDHTVIYNGVLTEAGFAERLAHQRSAGPRQRPFTFVMVGLIHPSKGQLEAIDAMAIVLRSGIPARLVIVGGGKEGPLHARIEELGIPDSVEFTGFLEDPFPVLIKADAFLMCSRNEAMGRVTVEAMACALPVIGHASGGTVELLEDGITGLLYTEGATDLAERMVLLLADPRYAVQLGEAGAVHAAVHFTIERYAQDVLKVYRSVSSNDR